MNDNTVKQWVDISLQKEKLVDYSFAVEGKTSKDSGYIGDITFLVVTGKDKNGKITTLNFVIKSSKESDNFRKQVPVKEVFEKEMYVYEKVVPAFENFQKELGLKKLVQLTPRCYATHKTDANEILILENLRPLNYKLWNRKVPMSYDHLKMGLEAFGKWHSLSFGLKKKQPDTFKNLTENNTNMFSEWLTKGKMFDYVWETFNNSKEILIRDYGLHPSKKINLSRADIEYILVDLFFEEPEHHVILHGDCWTNNFLFKYKKTSTKPLDIKFLDWQCSGLGSPVLDLSYFLYSCCSQEDLENFSNLLKIYHNSLSQQLSEFGLNPEEVYSYEALIKQWKKFSVYGAVMTAFILRFSLCEADEAPDFAEAINSGKSFLDIFKFALKHENVYLERVKNNLLHYVKHA